MLRHVKSSVSSVSSVSKRFVAAVFFVAFVFFVPFISSVSSVSSVLTAGGTIAQESLDRSKVPVPGKPPTLRVPTWTRSTLSNGAELIVSEKHDLPIVAFQITFVGGADQFGSIAVGKRADLVVIDGDPSARTTDIYKVTTVFKDGVGYDSAKLVGSVKGMVGIR